MKVNHNAWRLVGFYGHPVVSKRKCTSQLLKYLKSKCILPWVCMGDFNEIVCDAERVG